MSYRCNAPRDCGCCLWDFGRVSTICIEDECLDLVEEYDFSPCACGSKNKPVLYGEGMAKQYIKAKNEKSPLYFSEFDGYVVECTECGAITGHFNTPEKAIEAWNNKKLEYTGGKDI